MEKKNNPKPSSQPPIILKVFKDLAERGEQGFRQYGVALQPLNGRKPLQDAYEELLDLTLYIAQELEEDVLTHTEQLKDNEEEIFLQKQLNEIYGLIQNINFEELFECKYISYKQLNLIKEWLRIQAQAGFQSF